MPHHLSELKIHAFRGLSELTLADFGRVNLFVGANNSGKTSILEAIGLFVRPLDLQEWLNTAKRREIKSSRLSWVELIEYLFPHSKRNGSSLLKPEIQISGQGQFSGRSMSGVLQIDEYVDLDDLDADVVSFTYDRILVDISSRSALLGSDETVEAKTHLALEAHSSQVYFPKRTDETLLPLAHITPYSHRTERMQVETLSAAIEQDRVAELVAMLKEIDPDILDVTVLAPDGQTPRVCLRHQKAGMLPLSVMGDGMRRALVMASALSEIRNGVLLIDEIESALHVTALEKVFPWLLKQCESLNIQVFATTHSLEALDALMKGDPDGSQLVVYHLGQQAQPKRLQGDLLRRLRLERGLDVR